MTSERVSIVDWLRGLSERRVSAFGFDDSRYAEAAHDIERLHKERDELLHMNQQYVIEIQRLKRTAGE